MSIWRDRDLSRFFAIFPKSRDFCCFPRQMQLMLNTATFHKNCAICAWNSWISRKPTQSLATSTHITQSSLLHSHILLLLYYIACSFLPIFEYYISLVDHMKLISTWRDGDLSRFFTIFLKSRDFCHFPRHLPQLFKYLPQLSHFSAAIFWHP